MPGSRWPRHRREFQQAARRQPRRFRPRTVQQRRGLVPASTGPAGCVGAEAGTTSSGDRTRPAVAAEGEQAKTARGQRHRGTARGQRQVTATRVMLPPPPVLAPPGGADVLVALAVTVGTGAGVGGAEVVTDGAGLGGVEVGGLAGESTASAWASGRCTSARARASGAGRYRSARASAAVSVGGRCISATVTASGCSRPRPGWSRWSRYSRWRELRTGSLRGRRAGHHERCYAQGKTAR
jgi:hypothetical protein